MIWNGLGALAGIAVVGAIAGHVATAGDEPATRSIRVGSATLTVAGEWHSIDGPTTTLSDGLDSMRLVVAPPADASLVPPPLREEAPSRPPTAVRLGGFRAWSYGAVTVLPSTRGVLGLICDTGRCTGAVRSVSFAGGAVLAPAPDLALRLRAPSVLATLDAARVSARSAMKGPGAPVAEPASRLAAAHRAALGALRPIAAPALIAALSTAAEAYTRLARATSATTFNAARTEVIAADRAVDRAVARLGREGAPAVQRPPAPVAAASSGGSSLPTLVLVLAFALLLSAVVPGRVRAMRARTRDTPPEARSCVRGPRRRKPIAPPPTYGRWNEAPKGPSAGVTVSDTGARAGAMAPSSTT